MPHVFDAVFHHYQAVNAAANQLHPAFATTHLAAGVFAFAEGAAEGKHKAWLGEGKVEGIVPLIKLLAIVALQKFLLGGN